MATNAELLDIGTLIQIRMDNNYPALITELSNMGYNVTVLTPQADVMRILINLYKTDPASVWRILQSVPFNAAANNYTTSAALRQRVTEITAPAAGAAANQRGWDWLSGLYKPPTTTTTVSPTVTTTPTGSTATTAGLVAIAVVIVVSAYYLFR